MHLVPKVRVGLSMGRWSSEAPWCPSERVAAIQSGSGELLKGRSRDPGPAGSDFRFWKSFLVSYFKTVGNVAVTIWRCGQKGSRVFWGCSSYLPGRVVSCLTLPAYLLLSFHSFPACALTHCNEAFVKRRIKREARLMRGLCALALHLPVMTLMAHLLSE